MRPSVNRLTFPPNWAITASRSELSISSAALPAICTKGGVHESVVLIIVAIESVVLGDDTAKPSRHPLMLYDLLNVYAATAWSIIPG